MRCPICFRDPLINVSSYKDYVKCDNCFSIFGKGDRYGE
jgi:hypothetical protein